MIRNIKQPTPDNNIVKVKFKQDAPFKNLRSRKVTTIGYDTAVLLRKPTPEPIL